MQRKVRSSFLADMKLMILILLLVEFVRGAVLVSLLPIYGSAQLGLTADVIGIAISAHYITDTVLKIGIGYLLDRFSMKRIVQAGLVISLIGVGLMPFSTLPWMFIGSSALYGIGMSPIWIACLMKVPEEQRATGMGYLYTVWLLGLGSGPIVCNILLDYSYSFTYWLLAVLSALAAAFSFLIRRDDVGVPLARIPLRRQWKALRIKLIRMRMLLPGMILQTMAASMLVPILPAFAADRLHLSGTQYSILLTAGGLFAVLGLVPMGKLSDKLGGRRGFLAIGFILFAFGLYALAWEPSFWYCLIIAIGLGLSYSAILPSWNALLAAYVPQKQEGVGWGLLSTFEGVGVMIGPIVGGVIATASGDTAVFWTSAIIFLLIGLFYAMLRQIGVRE
ncbi:MFS transporter [Paenibacillus sp. J5C_2022]|uniref:MFS transporter n=1 Tax=Paenibacillus sp. J5C2022 TaxID=2977129 RepID=UPI0021D242F7|nr:MFS transporter [Paenibacillus sp. J5C2022]MCU6713168.1 MFS transporter [Paenibacillus sp. J5C2022]